MNDVSSHSDTKQMKKKLEMKRMERLEAITKNTMDKAAQERCDSTIHIIHITHNVTIIT